MAQTKHQIQTILTDAGLSPRQRLGQNFMIDQNLLRLVAEAAEIGPGDVVIEVGPGTGTLTEELLRAGGGSVVAVEVDAGLCRVLRERFGGNERFHLIEGDALAGKHHLNDELLTMIAAGPPLSPLPPGRRKLVANLPYNIASPLVIEMLIAGVDLLVFTVQREVAERMRGQPGHEEYGVLSAMTQLLAKVEILRTLPPQAFWPQPKVESALVRMSREDRLGDKARPLGKFLQGLFASRRKTLRKGLSVAGHDAEAVLRRTGLDGGKRPEELSPMELLRLFEAM